MSATRPAEGKAWGAEKRRSKREAAWRMRRLLAVSFPHIAISLSLFADLSAASLRSLVHCDTPAPRREPGQECPRGSGLLAGRCEAEPPASRAWSYSGACADRAAVLNSANLLQGHLVIVADVGMMVAVVFLGPLVDTWGRKPVMLLSMLGSCTRAVLFAAAARDGGAGGNRAEALVLAGTVTFSASNAYMLAMKAMAADLSPPDFEGRGAAFGALAMLFELSWPVGVLCGYFILRMHLTDYTLVWAAITLCMVLVLLFAALCLKPSAQLAASALQEEGSEDDSDSTHSVDSDSDGPPVVSCCLGALLEVVAIIRVIANDRLLRQLCLLTVFASVGIPAERLAHIFVVSYLGYAQENASMMGILVPFVAAGGSLIASRLVSRHGAYLLLGGAMVVNAGGWLLLGLCGPIGPGPGASVLFCCGISLAGLARGMIGAIFPAVFSVQVGGGLQGRLFAFVHICDLLGSSVGTALFTEYLFDAAWRGWKAGICFFVAAAMCLANAGWLAVISPDVPPRHEETDGQEGSE